MFNLKQSLISYLTTKNTDYAIEIDGNWGAGKTYYIKEFIREQEDAMKTENKKFIYLSCNGIQTIEDFQTRLLNSIVLNDNVLKESFGKTYGYLSRYADLFDNKSSIALRLVGDALSKTNEHTLETESKYRFILVLDDLERKSDKLRSKDLFGFISSFCLDTYNMKVIFIANEDKLTTVENEFSLIKEKIIFNTFSFNHSSKEIMKEIINTRFESPIYQALDKPWLNSVFTTLIKEENPNLRTILFIISSFTDLIAKITMKENYNSKLLYKMIICNLIIISMNYKNGTLKKIEQLEPIYSQKKVFSNVPNENSYVGTILNKYREIDLDVRDHIYFSRAISNLVINGYLDLDAYNKEIENYLLVEEKPLEWTPEQKAMEILNGFRSYTEERVKEAQRTLYDSLIYVDTETLKVCNLLYQFKEWQLYFLENESPLKKIIEALQLEHYNSEYFEKSSHSFETTFNIYCTSMKQQEEYNEFKTLMFQKFVKRNHINIIDRIQKVITEPFNNIYGSIQSTDLADTNVTQIINDTPVFLEAILTHPSKADFFKYLIDNSDDYFYYNSIPTELIHSIDKLLENINPANISAESDSIDKFKINEFTSTIKRRQTTIRNQIENERLELEAEMAIEMVFKE